MCRCGKQALWAFGHLLVWNRGGRATVTEMRFVFVCAVHDGGEAGPCTPGPLGMQISQQQS